MLHPKTRDRQPCKQPFAGGETAEEGKHPDRADVDEPGTVTSSFPVEMATSAHRSTFEEKVAALETELEAEGFLRFREIGPLYERVKVQDPTTRRPTKPTLVTSRVRPTVEKTAAITTRPQVQTIEAVNDPALRTRYLSLITAHRPITHA